MAYYDEKKNEEIGQGESIGPAGQATISGAGGSGGNSPQASEPASPQASSAGGPKTPFVGIKQYLDANKNQSQQLGQNVAGVVNQAGQDARGAVAQSQKQFNDEVSRNVVGLDNDLINRARQDVTSVAKSSADKTNFQKMRDAEYRGPTDLKTSQFYQPAQQALTKAQQFAQNTENEQGQRSLVNEVQKKGTGKIAGSGVTNFDQMLLGGAREQLEAARKAQSDLPEVATKAQAEAAANVQKAKDQTSATRKAIQDTFGYEGSVGQKQLEAQLAERAKQEQTKSNSLFSRLKQKLQTGAPISNEDLGYLGLSRQELDQISDQAGSIARQKQGGSASFAGDPVYDLGQFVQARDPSQSITAQNVASSEDYARYQALNDLMGTSNSFLSNPSLAGTANLDTFDFDKEAANRKIAAELAQSKPMERMNINIDPEAIKRALGPVGRVNISGNYF